ncbi:MAG: Transcriptional regulator, TetR family [Labilithrix sp.]|nr:Transcriptional regulator, TetR family [Labilithrix sp.]
MTTPKTGPGLRERKKLATRLAISDIATGLFIERGFDRVTIAEVAEAANVSVNTIFNYFSTKEELFFDRAEEMVDMPSRIVRERRRGEPIVRALRRGLRQAIEAADIPFKSGGNVERFFRTIEESPTLKAREQLLALESEQRLVRTLVAETGAKPDDPTARAIAAMVIGLIKTLNDDLRVRTLGRESAATMRAALVRLNDRGFGLLLSGAGDYGGDVRD